MSNLTQGSMAKRYRTPPDTFFNWKGVLDPKLYDMLRGYVRSYGVPFDYFLMPLLSVTASMMDNSYVCTHKDTRTEPAILWTVVSAPLDTHRSAVIKVFEEALRIVYRATESSESKSVEVDADGAASSAPYLINSCFTKPEIIQLLRGDRDRLFIYQNINSLLKTVDAHKSDLRLQLLAFYHSGIHRGPAFNQRAHVNLFGFVDPRDLLELLQGDDTDGFMANLIVAAPQMAYVKYDKFQQMAGTPIADLLLSIRKRNGAGIKYAMSERARQQFEYFYDGMVEQMIGRCPITEVNFLKVLDKAHGQVVRISMIVQAILNTLHDKEEALIDKDAVICSFKIYDHLCNKRMKLMDVSLNPKLGIGDFFNLKAAEMNRRRAAECRSNVTAARADS